MLLKLNKERIFYLNRNSKFKSLRKKLKKPLGAVIPYNHPFSTEYLISILKNFNTKVISVGDIVTKYLIEKNFIPDLSIIDNFSLKNKVESKDLLKHYKFSFYTKNNPGEISLDAVKTIENALKFEKSLVIVEGEEDLLALVAILKTSLNSFVVYGIPHLGVCLVKCTNIKKIYIKRITKRLFNE